MVIIDDRENLQNTLEASGMLIFAITWPHPLDMVTQLTASAVRQPSTTDQPRPPPARIQYRRHNRPPSWILAHPRRIHRRRRPVLLNIHRRRPVAEHSSSSPVAAFIVVDGRRMPISLRPNRHLFHLSFTVPRQQSKVRVISAAFIVGRRHHRIILKGYDIVPTLAWATAATGCYHTIAEYQHISHHAW